METPLSLVVNLNIPATARLRVNRDGSIELVAGELTEGEYLAIETIEMTTGDND